MKNLDHPLAPSLIRIHDLQGDVIGAGFLVTRELICTCAHVVTDALHISRETQISPNTEIQIDFPYLNETPASAAIIAWEPIGSDGGGDIAVLHLSVGPPPGARPVRMLIGSNVIGRQFGVYGFPLLSEAGVWAQGTLDHRLSNGLVQMKAAEVPGYRVQPGSSGGPVWDLQARGVVGMVVAAEKDATVKAAFLIPNGSIQRICSDIRFVDAHRPFAMLTEGLAGLLGSPLRCDPTVKAVAQAWPRPRSSINPITLWRSQKGGALTTSAMRQMIDVVMHDAAARGLVPANTSAHTLRHTFARNYLAEYPGDIVGLATLVGHTSLDTT